jgi:hypothetical protein
MAIAISTGRNRDCQYAITAAGRIGDSTGRDRDRNLYSVVELAILPVKIAIVISTGRDRDRNLYR